MATQTRIVNGKKVVVSKKESPAEFSKRLRERNKARRKARNIRSKGGKAFVENIGGKSVVVQVKKPQEFEVRTSGGTLFAKGTKADIATALNKKMQVERSAALRTARSIQEKSNNFRPALITGVPSGTIIAEQIRSAKQKTSAPISQAEREVVRFTRTLDIKPSKADLREYNRLKKFGVDKEVAFRIAVDKKRQKEKAIAKVLEIQRIQDKRSKNYERAVNNFIDRVNKIGFNSKIKKGSFQDKTERLTLIKISKWLNPIIVVTEIGASLSQFKTLREAGIINPQAYFQKLPGRTATGLRKILTTNPRITIKELNKNLENFSVSAIKSAKKNLNPNTPEGLSNIITLSFFLRPDRFIKSAGIKVVNAVKAITRNPSVRRVLSTAVRAPAFATVGVVAAGGKGVKIKGKPLSKAAKRAASRGVPKKAGKLTTAQVKRQRKQLRKEAKRIADAQFQGVPKSARKVKTSGRFGFFETGKNTAVFTKDGKVVGKLNFKLTARSTSENAIKKGISSKNKLQNKIPKKSINVGGGQVAIQKAKAVKKASPIPKKVQNKSRANKVIEKRTKSIFNKYYSDRKTVVKDLRPETVYPELIVPSTAGNTRGLVKGVRPGMVKKIQNSIDRLKKEAVRLRRDFIKDLTKEVNKNYRSLKNKQLVWSVLRKELFRPKINTDLFKSLFGSRATNKIANSLRVLAFLNFNIDEASKFLVKVQKLPIARVKQGVSSDTKARADFNISFVSGGKKAPVRKKRRTTTKKKVVPRRTTKIVKRVVPPKRVSKIVKKLEARLKRSNKRLTKRRFKFYFDIKKSKRIKKVVRDELEDVPKKFRPTLEAIYFEIVATKAPQKITGLEVRPIIRKLVNNKRRKNR